MNIKQNKFLLFAWIVSIVATLGSLYFSEVKQFIPCELCWYQRIGMYPLVIILGVAMFKKQSEIIFYVLPITIIGMCIAIYHYSLQMVVKESTSFCQIGCAGKYVDWLGFITIPFLSLVAFLLITVFLIINYKINKRG